MKSRTEILKASSETHWDIIVVGGGITGAGILLEATRRGLKCLLVEKRDFAWGTSSRSSKMVHGGLRYLAQGDFSLTRHSVLERDRLLKDYQGLVETEQFVLPLYNYSPRKRLILHFGIKLYDLFAGTWQKRSLTPETLTREIPLLASENLTGGFSISDAVTDDARLVFRVLSDAISMGGTAVNYTKANDLIEKKGEISGIATIDTITKTQHTFSGRIVINASGAWADQLRKRVSKSTKKRIRPLRGSHLIFSKSRVPLNRNISFAHPEDRRWITALSWEDHVLLGTTDVDHRADLNQEASISLEETRYLLDGFNSVLPGLKLTESDVISTMAGIRPVIDSGKKDPSKEARDHAIWLENGLLTVTGGKLTIFRLIALDALKAARKQLGRYQVEYKTKPTTDATANALNNSLSKLTLEDRRRLNGRYGYQVRDFLDEASPEELERIPGTNTLWAELRWAARNEMVTRLEDLMLRRTRIGLLLPDGAKDILPKIKPLCQSELNWSDGEWIDEARRYLDTYKKYYGLPSTTT